MKTQISIQVKNENWISRCMSIYMTLGLFVKAKVNVYMDDPNAKPIILKARKEPYVMDVEPGQHVFAFTAKSKANVDKLLSGAVAGAIGLGSGDAYTTMAAAQGGSDLVTGLMGYNQVKDNILECALKEGDILKLCVQPKRNGMVTIKVL